jgi:hypothetical protein
MKYVTTLMGLCGLLSAQAFAAPIEQKRNWIESFDVGSAPTLEVSNIWGNVTVTKGRSDRIEMTIESVRRAHDQASFDLSLEQIPLKIEHHGDAVSLVVGKQQDWRNAPRCHGCRVHVDLVVRVPQNTALTLRTINDGDIIVSGVRSRIAATNVNGSVSSRGLTQCDEIETVNGDIDVQFVDAPGSDCRIQTLNGDIDLTLTDDSDVNLAVDVGNGRLRSALDLSPQTLPAEVQHKVRGGRHVYNIEQSAGLQLGRGGHLLKLKSFNGDITVAGSQ